MNGQYYIRIVLLTCPLICHLYISISYSTYYRHYNNYCYHNYYYYNNI